MKHGVYPTATNPVASRSYLFWTCTWLFPRTTFL